MVDASAGAPSLMGYRCRQKKCDYSRRVVMNPRPEINILPFQPEDQTEAKNLVLAGLSEHWGTLDPGKNPDLNDIGLTYANAVFLIAWRGKKIIGTGALVPKSIATAEIVRMSVVAEMRRNGIGGMILQRLCENAKSKGYACIPFSIFILNLQNNVKIKPAGEGTKGGESGQSPKKRNS